MVRSPGRACMTAGIALTNTAHVATSPFTPPLMHESIAGVPSITILSLASGSAIAARKIIEITSLPAITPLPICWTPSTLPGSTAIASVLLLDALILAYVRGERQSYERRTLLVLAAALILFAVQAVREPGTVLNARQGPSCITTLHEGAYMAYKYL